MKGKSPKGTIFAIHVGHPSSLIDYMGRAVVKHGVSIMDS